MAGEVAPVSLLSFTCRAFGQRISGLAQFIGRICQFFSSGLGILRGLRVVVHQPADAFQALCHTLPRNRLLLGRRGDVFDALGNVLRPAPLLSPLPPRSRAASTASTGGRSVCLCPRAYFIFSLPFCGAPLAASFAGSREIGLSPWNPGRRREMLFLWVVGARSFLASLLFCQTVLFFVLGRSRGNDFVAQKYVYGCFCVSLKC